MPHILAVHGVGDHHTDLSWQQDWRNTIAQSIKTMNPQAEVQVDFVALDDIFDEYPLNAAIIAEALEKLLANGLGSVRDALEEGLLGRARGLGDISATLRWTAGMALQWVENDRLRADTRQRLLDGIAQYKPDVVCAHSLGSLVGYDTLTDPKSRNILQGKMFVSLGSQIANPFVLGTFSGGRIADLNVGMWYHLFNKHDRVFTAPIALQANNFAEVETPFYDNWHLLNHDAILYFGQPNTVNLVWRDVAAGAATSGLTGRRKAFAELSDLTRPPIHRALLVGINEYPKEQDRLAGCVNDVFLMSSMLQESGFQAEDIRVVLDERATASGIRERLEWLLDGAAARDQRVFFYSGHGAQLPGYNTQGQVDHVDACLVPVDFAWSQETAITDDMFMHLYSQLPYDTRFLVIFDCCYSGAMTRQGGARVRGLNPPDDIRHRLLRWDTIHEMWVPRPLPAANPSLAAQSDATDYVGESRATRLLGRAVGLRTLPNKTYDQVRKALGHHGPYLPIVYEACREDQYSYEYRHGVTSYGAFTYCLARILRDFHKQGVAVTFERLLQETAEQLTELDYQQTPVLVGPKELLKRPIPWQRPAKPKKNRSKRIRS